MEGGGSGFSWPTFLASGVLTLVVSLLTILFGEPLKRWVNRNEPLRKRRLDEELQALDDYSTAIRKTEALCLDVGRPQINPEKLIREANASLTDLAAHVETLAGRLPSKIRTDASALAKSIRNHTATYLMLALAVPPGGVVVGPLIPKIAGFSNELKTARIAAENVRSKMIGH